MTTFLQLHLLTAYPPANLNRDDTGRPKTCVFGGAPRLRISSQSLKRAWRTSDVFEDKFKDRLAKRTQGLGRIVCDRLIDKGVPAERAEAIARTLAAIVGAPSKKGGDQTLTEQLVFLRPEEIKNFEQFADEIVASKDLQSEFEAASNDGEEGGTDTEDEGSKKNKAKGSKKDKNKKLDSKRISELRKKLLQERGPNPDMSMFGRMLADSPQFNVEAAVQIAHALSTHKVAVEDDYYVAVEELKERIQREDSGASFIGVQEFAAGLFYLYACVDVDLLKRNLDGDAALAEDAIEALLKSAATVAPTGKQASFASRARATFVMAERGSQQPRSLAAAFLKPVSPVEAGGDLALASVERLESFRSALDQAYGDNADAHSTMTALPGRVNGSLTEIVKFCRKAAA